MMKQRRPHILVDRDVQSQWSSHQFKGFFQWIIELGEISPSAIEIIQMSDYDKEHKMCEGEIVNHWRYDNKGFHFIAPEEELKDKVVETCSFCIDKEQKRLLIVWSNILGSASSRKKIHYFHTGTLYKMVLKDGIEDFEIISSWIE